MDQYIFIPSLTKLKKEIRLEKKAQYRALLEEANRLFCLPLYVEPPKKSTTYIAQAMCNLTLCYRLSEDEKYLQEALRIIETVLSYPYWGNAHLVNVDLSASFLLFGLSLSYHYIKEDLSEKQQKRIEEKLLYQAQLMFDYSKEHEDSWPRHYFQNHNWINFTGLAMVGYVLQEKYPKVAIYKEAAKENFHKVFSYLPEDGSDYEGATYWRYGVLWLYIYAYLLKEQEGIDYFKTSGFLKNTFDYRLYQSASNLNKQLNFGDCHDLYSSHSVAMYYLIAGIYHNGYAQKLGNEIFTHYLYEEQYNSKIKPGILPEAYLTLLWYQPRIQEKDLDALPKVKYFKDLGLICVREGFKKQDKVFSIKCSYPGGKKQWYKGIEHYQKTGQWILSLAHHHPDNLSYIFTGGDDYYACDEGYNRMIEPSDHNVLLVDHLYSDVMQTNDVYMRSIQKRLEETPFYDAKKYRGTIRYFFMHEDIVAFQMENHAIYPLSLKMKEVSRTVLLKGLHWIVMMDTFDSFCPHIYESVLNQFHPMKEVGEGYQIFTLDEEMYYYVFSSDALEMNHTIQEIKSIMTTQEPDVFTRNMFHRYIASTKEKKKKHMRIEVFSTEKLQPRWQKNTFILTENERILFKKNYDFDFDGKMLYLRYESNYLKELVLLEGTFVSYKGQELIRLPKKGSAKKGDFYAILK